MNDRAAHPTCRHPETLRWVGDEQGYVELIDQTLLPERLEYLRIDRVEAMRDAIRRLAVRGAPAIGVAASYGVVVGLRDATTPADFDRRFDEARAILASSRPTAVNLFFALDRMAARNARDRELAPEARRRGMLAEARALHAEDADFCRRLGEVGGALIQDGDRLLTHCNAGALATAGQGTALSVMYAAQAAGKRFSVWVDETRPLLQGARLTAWELMQAGIEATLICDNAAAHVMRTRGVDRVFVGADRIAGNGDAANKIGTYSVAVAAAAHGVPFYVVAPSSTFDLGLASGDEIPIEERSGEEIVAGFGRRTAPPGVSTYAPAFDVTPARLIRGIVTERGLIEPVTAERIRAVLA